MKLNASFFVLITISILIGLYLISLSSSSKNSNECTGTKFGLQPILNLNRNELKQRKDADEIPWSNTPNVSIVCRLYSGNTLEYYNTFLVSYLLFWPIKKWSNSNLVAVFDAESESDHRMATLLANLPPYPNVYFEPKPNKPLCSSWTREGYARGMYSNLHADLYTNSDYIAVTDVDTFFVIKITPEDLFHSGKPRIVGFNACCGFAFAKASFEAIGVSDHFSEFTFTSGFPIMVKREHFAQMRQHITKQLNAQDFNEAFNKICSKYIGAYSQWDLLAYYLWNFKRDEYSWHLRDFIGSDHPSARRRASENEQVLKANIPTISVMKHAEHNKEKTNYVFNLIYDYLCVASENEAGDCKLYSNEEIYVETKKNLFMDWSYQTAKWNERKMPKLRRKLEKPWSSKNLSWNEAYQKHLLNLIERNISNNTFVWNKVL